MWRLVKLMILTIGFAAAIKPHSASNGRQRNYNSNKNDLSLDLKVITPQEASFIGNYWLDNIIDNNGNFLKEDKQIIDRINHLEKYRQEISERPKSNDKDSLLLAWIPQGIYSEILFIVCCDIDKIDKIINVILLVQSPYWDSSQIGSEYLKESLQYLADHTNSVLNLDILYSKDARYKLAWKNWNK
jgi:hypothetical protein